MKKIILIIATSVPLILYAGAMLDKPLQFQAIHGGLVHETKQTLIEVVQEKERTSIYITGKDHKNITDKVLSLSAIAEINGKKIPLRLSYENDHYSTSPTNSYLRKENNFVLMLSFSFGGLKEQTRIKIMDK